MRIVGVGMGMLVVGVGLGFVASGWFSRDESGTADVAYTKARLDALEGSPSDWPEEVPPAYEPEAFRDHVETALAEFVDGDAEFDCAEFPCIAILPPELADTDYPELLKRLGQTYGDGEEFAKRYMAVRKDPAGLPASRVAKVFAYLPQDHLGEAEVTRLQSRLDAFKSANIEELEAELGGDQAP